MQEKIKDYIRAALGRKYPIEKIIDNLVSVGHDPHLVRRLAREAISERLHELEQEIVGDPISKAEKAAQRTMLELLFMFVLRVAAGTLFFFTFAPLLLQKVYA